MKNLLPLSLFLLVFLVPSICQSTSFPVLYPEDVEEELELLGTLGETTERSPQTNPIQATISSTSLNVAFLSNVGNISVEVYTASGSQVYINNVNTQTQPSLSIDITTWNVGAYEIRFVNSSGNYMYGTFDIDAY